MITGNTKEYNDLKFKMIEAGRKTHTTTQCEVCVLCGVKNKIESLLPEVKI